MDSLKEWTINFVKNKDIYNKNLVDYEEKENLLLFHFKNDDKRYLVLDVLDKSVLLFVKQPGFKVVVCNAKKENRDFLVNSWSSFVNVDNFSFIFVKTNTNARWIINPFVHARICDEESLVLGLKSMYSSVF